MAKKEKVEVEQSTPVAPIPDGAATLGDLGAKVTINGADVPLKVVDDEPDDDADDETEHPARKRNIVYVGKGEAPDQLSLNDGGAPLTVRFRHDTARQRAGFYHRRAALIIADARDSKGKRLYKAFREDKGA